MCLAVPGKIIHIEETEDKDSCFRQGKVDFGGVRKQVSLAFVPEACLHDYVLVHAGVAIEVMDETAALETLAYLSAFGEPESEQDAPEAKRDTGSMA
ncbi:MAG: hypothetical protein RLY31_2793 [Bacteroidota bacterium]|jgi:hydrogenase expression/formation protein HypC